MRLGFAIVSANVTALVLAGATDCTGARAALVFSAIVGTFGAMAAFTYGWK